MLAFAPLFLAPLLSAAPAPARASTDAVLDALNRVTPFEETVIAPDGKHVAWVEGVPTPDGPAAGQGMIGMADVAHPGVMPARITAVTNNGYADEGAPVFSPDGTQVAFLSDAGSPGQQQLWVQSVSGGQARRLTQLHGHLDRPSWSPDGKRLAVLYIEGGNDLVGPLGPSPRAVGVVEETIREQRIAVLPATGGAVTQVSPADLFVYEYAWSPDGTRFVATGAHGSGDNNWWFAKLWSIPSGGGEAKVLYTPRLQLCQPTFSPDGKRVAFIEGLMSDQGSDGGDVFVMSSEGGTPRDVTPSFAGTPSHLTWSAASGLVSGAQVGGESAFLAVDPDGRAAPKVLWRGAQKVHTDWNVGASFSSDGRTSAVIEEAFERAPEVAVGKLGAWTPITHANTSIQVPVGPTKDITWRSDRFHVQGWLVEPKPGTREGSAPLIVLVHGGPSGGVTPSFFGEVALFTSQGYAVFLPNFRGSFGQGEAFTRANVKDFGYGDLRDILAGVDAVVRSGGIDGTRVGITGHSYGGYMTMWAVTQTQRFRTAVASAGIANWQSYYGENGIDQWMIPFFGATVYDNPAVYARSSPITFIKKVHTPTLVLVGERDAECPAPQSFEFWHALKTLKVPTQLVVYPDEGHHVRQPKHVHDIARRTIAWFDERMK